MQKFNPWLTALWCYAINRDDFCSIELATQLISHHASIFLAVIILGMNEPRPWKCPWTSLKKRTKNESTAMSEQAKVDGKLKLRLSGIKPTKDPAESWQRCCKDSTCSFWLAWACLLYYPIRRAFLQHISWRVSVESVINKRKCSCHFALWMFVHPTNMAVILDLKGFLINQKLFLSTSEYQHYYQGRRWNMPDFWNWYNNSLSKVDGFISRYCVFFYYWTCFSRLAALVCFLAVVPFVAFPNLLLQLQEKNEQPKKVSPLWAQCETLRVD